MTRQNDAPACQHTSISVDIAGKVIRNLPNITDLNFIFFIEINPGQAGCTYTRQCSAVWPNAYCGSGSCHCGNNAPPFPTKDGLVCVNFGAVNVLLHHCPNLNFSGFCPINGRFTKVKDDSGITRECGGFAPFCPPGYDCICSNQNCAIPGVTSFCCPSRGELILVFLYIFTNLALACIAPRDSGSRPTSGGGSITRYYHNSVTGSCDSFNYYGEGGNANNFESLDQCNSYCKHSNTVDPTP